VLPFLLCSPWWGRAGSCLGRSVGFGNARGSSAFRMRSEDLRHSASALCPLLPTSARHKLSLFSNLHALILPSPRCPQIVSSVGMPPIVTSHATASIQSPQPPKMEVTLPPIGREKGQPAICPTDDDTIAPRHTESHRKVDKRSLDYVLRTGLAGGMAGCAVSLPYQNQPCCTGDLVIGSGRHILISNRP